MDTKNNANRIHPLVAAAAVSVVLVSLVGIAAITGLLPDSHGNVPAVAALNSSVDEKVAASDSSKEEEPVPAKSTASSSAQKSPATPQPRPARTSSQRNPEYHPPVVAKAPICQSCGRVESVQAVRGEASPSGLGVVAGGVVGGLLGNQVGGGSGRALATVAGVVGGGYAGNEIEKRTKTSYQVRVRMDNGTVRSFPYDNQPGWNVGDRIRVVDGYLTARG